MPTEYSPFRESPSSVLYHMIHIALRKMVYDNEFGDSFISITKLTIIATLEPHHLRPNRYEKKRFHSKLVP
jgi:hypothetical protein